MKSMKSITDRGPKKHPAPSMTETELWQQRARLTHLVKEVIVRALDLQIDPGEISDDEAIFGGGFNLDSVAALEIVFAIEEEFGFEVEDGDLQVELFDSVRALSNYVERKIGQEPPAGPVTDEACGPS